MEMVVKWLFTSSLGRGCLAAVALLLLGLWLRHAVAEWEEQIYNKGFEKAAAECEEKRKAYFDGAAESAKRLEALAAQVLRDIEKSGTKSAAKIDSTVQAAVTKWAKNPVIVYNEDSKKCELQPDFQTQWNAINRGATP